MTCGHVPKGKGRPDILGARDVLNVGERKAFLVERRSGQSESSWDHVCFEEGGALAGPVRYVEAEYRPMLHSACLVCINAIWTLLVMFLILGGVIDFLSVVFAGQDLRFELQDHGVAALWVIPGIALLISFREWMRFRSERGRMIHFENR
ncbi:hypothetical protein [Pseudosulfitobacter pseudonitzschiae]|uniref:hypothetical protein n=1 Tax=Pseudosulfitobacter pseudonitzschiae TaxID=1402135 RepID=UPI003B75DE5A